MNTYKPTTTLEAAKHHREFLAAKLAQTAATGSSSELLPILQALAATEVQVDVYTVMDRIVETLPGMTGGVRATEVRAYIESLVTNGPDDTWSGRGNDLARVRYDALLQIARDLRYVKSI